MLVKGVSNVFSAIIGSHNVLSPGRQQAIIWTNAGMLLNRPLGTNFSEIITPARGAKRRAQGV